MRERSGDFRQIVRMDEFKSGAADEFFRLVAENARDRRALIADGAVRFEDADDVEGVFSEQTEVCVRCGGLNLLGKAGRSRSLFFGLGRSLGAHEGTILPSS